jgi:hypothetical protein
MQPVAMIYLSFFYNVYNWKKRREGKGKKKKPFSYLNGFWYLEA